MNTIRYRIVTGVLVLVWMGVIFFFSHQPSVQSEHISGGFCGQIVSGADKIFDLQLTQAEKDDIAERIEFPVRKAAHMTEYAVLSLLLSAFYRGILRNGRYWYPASLVTAALYAGTDEIHQLFIPGRSGEFRDVCIDSAGAALGLLILYFILKIVQKHCAKTNLPLQ